MLHLNIIRAIAILLIVVTHAQYVAKWVPDSYLGYFVANLYSGGTILFIFISGYIFHKLSSDEFVYAKFVRAKFTNVFVPYLVLSIVPIGFRMYVGFDKYGSDYLVTSGSPIEAIRVFLYYLWAGRQLTGYWFVPVVMLIFASAPLHLRFINLSFKAQSAIIIILTIVASLIHRPEDNVGVLQLYCYFTPVYLFGVFCSVHHDKVNAYIEANIISITIFVALFIFFAPFSEEVFNHNYKPAFVWNGIDYILIEKLIVAVLLVTLLYRYRHKRIWFFELIASASLAIYFIHPWIITALSLVLGRNYYYGSSDVQVAMSWPGMPIITLILLVGSISVGVAVKLIFKRKSKGIIGW